MFTKIKLALSVLTLSFFLAAPSLMVATPAYAATSKDAACAGIGFSGADCGKAQSTNKVGGVISTLVNFLTMIVGVIAVVMVIIAGFKYVTSNGDTNNVASAKNTLLYAAIGLVIVALAQFIVHFVINKAS